MSQEPQDLTRLMAAVVTSGRGTNRLMEAAGELIAEDARFNMWVLAHKANLSEADQWNVFALAEVLVEECRAAWATYLSLGREERAAGHARVLEAFNGAGERMRKIRTTGRVDYEDPDMPFDLDG